MGVQGSTYRCCRNIPRPPMGDYSSRTCSYSRSNCRMSSGTVGNDPVGRLSVVLPKQILVVAPWSLVFL